ASFLREEQVAPPVEGVDDAGGGLRVAAEVEEHDASLPPGRGRAYRSASDQEAARCEGEAELRLALLVALVVLWVDGEIIFQRLKGAWPPAGHHGMAIDVSVFDHHVVACLCHPPEQLQLGEDVLAPVIAVHYGEERSRERLAQECDSRGHRGLRGGYRQHLDEGILPQARIEPGRIDVHRQNPSAPAELPHHGGEEE